MAMTIYRLGAMSLLFAGGIFFEEPIHGYLAQNQSSFYSFLLLYGLPVLAGFTFLTITWDVLQSGEKRVLYLCNGISILSISWLSLWVLMWFSMMHFPLSLINLIGVASALGMYLMGWKKALPIESALWYLMSSGWSLGYMGWINLYLQPNSRHLWGDAIGGSLVLIGTFLLQRSLVKK